MIKYYLILLQLAWLPAKPVQAQFFAGAGGFFISSGTQVSLNGLTMQPAADFTIASNKLTISATPVTGNPASIAKVYTFSQPVDYVGNLGLKYLTSDLNGNNESTLQLAHGNQTFVTTTGGVVDPVSHYIFANLASLTNFTSVTAAQEGALPVTLVAFRAHRMEGMTWLNWQTSAEENSDFFEVQQSIDARKWNFLGKVSASRDSKELKDYSFQDAAPRSGRQYYRLKMTDADGSYAYSAIRSIDLGSVEIASVYPNPLTDKFTIAAAKNAVSLELTDVTGQHLLNLPKPVDGQEVNMENYAAGIYLLHFKMADGKKDVVKIFKY
ncbi:T9SS type A sorting domain-containing protein [Dyadobacter crusticola]|uniref:T9SS type A sorting domain-containing protein n=1 Tax=Dyadobacter crusticola TaxID=292407 RepID=UPI0004E28697|nr:T9SS type A sorting domain-containing protein [Dyadobacter crusticola]